MAEPLKTRRYFTGISRDTVLLAFASLFADISTEMLYPILPIFLTQVLRASGGVVGLVEGVAQATQNIVQGFSGWLSDKLRKRKALALAGYFLAAMAKPLMGLSQTWPQLLAGRFMDRLGTGTRSAPRDALVAASVAEENRGRAFGLEGFGDNLGAFLGPLLAILLVSSFHFNFRWIFYLALVPGLLAFSMTLLVRETAAAVPVEAKMKTSWRQLPESYWKYLLVTALFGIGNSSNSFLILRSRDAGASIMLTILIYAGFNLVAALISYPAGSLSDKFGRKRILLLAFLVFFVAYVGFAVTKTTAGIAFVFIFYGLFQGIFRSVGKAFAADFVPQHLRASGVGWYSTTVGLLGLVASIVAGQLWDRIGHAAVFYFGACSAIAGSIGLLVLLPARRKAAPLISESRI